LGLSPHAASAPAATTPARVSASNLGVRIVLLGRGG
jgi:hypothetical protein